MCLNLLTMYLIRMKYISLLDLYEENISCLVLNRFVWFHHTIKFIMVNYLWSKINVWGIWIFNTFFLNSFKASRFNVFASSEPHLFYNISDIKFVCFNFGVKFSEFIKFVSSNMFIMIMISIFFSIWLMFVL